jgi:circadian clock protein KaiC
MSKEEAKVKTAQQTILKTGVTGFDTLFSNGGIPKGNSVLVAGGAGTGKSTLCRQICYNLVSQNRHCMYVSFEESIDRIEKSMITFGWDVKKYRENGSLLIQKINPLDILRMKFGGLGGSGSATEVSYKIKPLIIPKDFNPEVIVVDSLTAIIAASITKEKSYRVYLQQLFNFFEETGSTSFLVTETEQIPKKYSDSGIEEFLADGIIVLYNLQTEKERQNAIEVLKMRYTGHAKKIFAFDIKQNGITIYPTKEIMFSKFK